MITAKFRYMTCHWTGTSMNPDGKGCVPSCITADKPGLTAGLKKEYGYVVKKSLCMKKWILTNNDKKGDCNYAIY